MSAAPPGPSVLTLDQKSWLAIFTSPLKRGHRISLPKVLRDLWELDPEGDSLVTPRSDGGYDTLDVDPDGQIILPPDIPLALRARVGQRLRCTLPFHILTFEPDHGRQEAFSATPQRKSRILEPADDLKTLDAKLQKQKETTSR